MAVYPTLRKAIHETYQQYPHKEALAGHCQWGKEEISKRANGALPFPADDPVERIVLMMQNSGDYSYLETLAYKCGRGIHLLSERYGEVLQQLHEETRQQNRRIEQLALMIPITATITSGKPELRSVSGGKGR